MNFPTTMNCRRNRKVKFLMKTQVLKENIAGTTTITIKIGQLPQAPQLLVHHYFPTPMNCNRKVEFLMKTQVLKENITGTTIIIKIGQLPQPPQPVHHYQRWKRKFFFCNLNTDFSYQKFNIFL